LIFAVSNNPMTVNTLHKSSQRSIHAKIEILNLRQQLLSMVILNTRQVVLRFVFNGNMKVNYGNNMAISSKLLPGKSFYTIVCRPTQVLFENFRGYITV